MFTYDADRGVTDERRQQSENGAFKAPYSETDCARPPAWTCESLAVFFAVASWRSKRVKRISSGPSALDVTWAAP